MTIHHSNTGYEPNSEMDMSGRFVPIVELTHDDDDANSHMSPIAGARESNTFVEQVCIGNVLASWGRPHAKCSQSPTDTKSEQLRYAVTYPQSVPAALGPQETVQLVTRRARESLNFQRETARRPLLPQQGDFPAATHQYEAAARQNLVSTLATNNEAHNDYVQMQVRQLKHARNVPKDKGKCYRDFLRKQIKLLEISEKFR